MLKTLLEAFALISPGKSSSRCSRHRLWPRHRIVARAVATMATALLVPVTFYLSPIAAIATIVAASSMAIFSGDIPARCFASPARRLGGVRGRSLRDDAQGRG